MTSDWCLGLPLILLPFLSLPYSLYILWPTPLLLPCHPSTPVTYPVFSIIIPFFFISVLHQLLLPLSCFRYLFLGSLLTAKMSKQCTGFYTLFSSIATCTIKSFSTRVSLYIQYAVCHLIRPYPAACLAAIHFNCASVYMLTGDYTLPLSSDKTWDGLQHIGWSGASYWHDFSFFTIRTKPNPLQDRVSPHTRSLVNSSRHESQKSLARAHFTEEKPLFPAYTLKYEPAARSRHLLQMKKHVTHV